MTNGPSRADSATVTWNSEADVLYTVSRSFDLGIWDDIEDSAVGQEGTTTFNDFGSGPKAFYRVSINPSVP
ncbi:MAG: hypothetical protein ACPGJR_01540 [Akkermansiaceae bacterium]